MTMALALPPARPPDDTVAARPAPGVLEPSSSPADDAVRALFLRARDDDGAALDALCRLMRPRLYRTAWSVLRDRDEADDVAQEALVRAVTKRWLFVGRGSVGGWMTRIALNLAKNRRRDHARRGQLMATALPAELIARGALAEAQVSPDQSLIATVERGALVAAVAKLSERQRDVVSLRAIGGLDFRSVAETLGISEENARVTFSQAKKSLMTTLSRGGDR
jgi:RNA polymerase sigma-70 factor (ECF subfamily)